MHNFVAARDFTERACACQAGGEKSQKHTNQKLASAKKPSGALSARIDDYLMCMGYIGCGTRGSCSMIDWLCWSGLSEGAQVGGQGHLHGTCCLTYGL
jgi:hypothetical protein